MKKYVVIIWLAIPVVGFSQPSHGEEAYKEFIRKFYYHLLEDNKVTVNEATDLFGSNALEDESFIFNAICDSDPNQKICSERSIYGHEWGDITSVFFSELKKNKKKGINSIEILENCLIKNRLFFSSSKTHNLRKEIGFCTHGKSSK